jgi:protein O-GlcNAc transferase
MEALGRELRLLLACARVNPSLEDQRAIRHLLADGVDWTAFARKAVDHGLAGLSGDALSHVAADLVPEDILEALGVVVDQTRKSNQDLFDELGRLLEALSVGGIDAIPFKGPVLAIQAFGDLGLRGFRDLDFLIHYDDLRQTIVTLRDFGYERQGHLSAAQFEMIHRLQGQEIIFKQSIGTAVEPHTRFTPITMALDIDYGGLWQRAQRQVLNGRSMLTLAPEDDLIILAIHGGKELWWNIKWACDIAAFIRSYPELDWTVIENRARAQGCLRMVLLATSLARKYFSATVPDWIVAIERADPAIEPMVGRILEHWQAEGVSGPPSNKTLSLDRLRLHDGVARRASYVARTLFLPKPHHVGMAALPPALSFAYVPLKLSHDLIALPVYRAYEYVSDKAKRVRHTIFTSDIVLTIIPASAEEKRSIKRYRKMRDAAQLRLAADPSSGPAWRFLGFALSGLKKHREAIACYDKALVYEPDSYIVWQKRDAAVKAIGETSTLPSLAYNPQDANGWVIRAGRLLYDKRFMEAAETCDRALALDPNHIAAARVAIHSRLHACDWRKREEDKRRTSQGIRARQFVVRSVDHRALSDSEEELRLSGQPMATEFPRSVTPLWRGERYRHDKIRIAYISTDFRNHVVAMVFAGCIEQHDKSRFETIAISLGPDDGRKMRKRLEAAFDRFIDVQTVSDVEVATMLRELEVDIAIDLNGYSGENRTGILARRPAPVQVNYLGFAGTMDEPFIDYIIADKIVIPPENQVYYGERVVYLPCTFFPADRSRQIAEARPSRAEVGLPETGFVFACMNNGYKFSPEMFDIWMRLLHAVEGSVLWIRPENRGAMSNLRREASARGVAPERLVVARQERQIQDHLARLRLADLFLDTRPYNAHATAQDALWAGLPVLTCPGDSFASRVAASQLHAIGLPELVASSLAEYEDLALSLARSPEKLAAIKAKLLRNQETEPLFDTTGFTRYLEAAYTTMWQRQQEGLPPESFTVPA